MIDKSFYNSKVDFTDKAQGELNFLWSPRFGGEINSAEGAIFSISYIMTALGSVVPEGN